MICTGCFQAAAIKLPEMEFHRREIPEDKQLPAGKAMPDTSRYIAVFTKDSFELTRNHTPKLEILWSASV